MKKQIVAGLATAVFLILGANSLAKANTLTFDNITSLNEYTPDVTFSNNASIWTYTGPTVLQNPDGGAYSFPSALQFGNAGGVLGYTYFSNPQTEISVWALSGPGPDKLSSGMYIKAFDTLNVLVAEDYVNSSLQFDLLSLSGSNMVSVEFWSPNIADDVWDNLTFAAQPVPLPATILLFGTGLAGLAGTGIRRRKKTMSV